MNLNIEPLGWNASFQLSFDTVNDGSLIPSRIVRENRGQYIVNTGRLECAARLAGSFHRDLTDEANLPTVGDWVAAKPELRSDELTIRTLLPRKSLFSRQAVGKRASNQLIAANFDFLFLVSGLDGDFNPRRIQRYLGQAWNSRAQPVIVLNKSDLCKDLSDVVEEIRKISGEVPIHTLSAMDPSSISCLADYFGYGKSVALLGSSGVGKSTLVNAVLGEHRLATQTNRESDSRGKHTTTWRELLLTPNGGTLIDLPGMRELQLTGDEEGLSKTFSDIEELARSCRFRDCRHQGEPGCAIEHAIESGDLDQDRYLQYLKLSEESARAKARHATREKQALTKKKKFQEKDRIIKERTATLKRNSKSLRKFRGRDEF